MDVWDIKLLLLIWTISMCNGSPKNVLFLVADDLRPELGAYDGPDSPSQIHPKMHTPNIDSLAAKSLLLKRAYVQHATCSPSRTSLLTGRRPDTTHVYDLKAYFRNVGGNYTTIPQYFKQNGYSSIGMGKIFHPGVASGNNDDAVSWSKYIHGDVRNFETKDHAWLAVPDDDLINKTLVDEQIANYAIQTLREVAANAKSGNQPFFVAVGFHKPHLPFVFPQSMLQYYPSSSVLLPDNPYVPINMPDVAWSTYGDLRTKYNDIISLNITGAINTTLPDETVLELRRAYYCAVTWMDSLIGRVVAELDNLGLSNSTVVSFIGDHGYQLGEHGEWTKHTNFELATHAPMMIHIPGMTNGGIQTEQLTEFVDLFPTLVEAAGFPPLPLCPEDSTHVELCTEGKSLLPLINNPNVTIKTGAFSQYPRNKRNKNAVMGYSIRTDSYRYTEWPKVDYGPAYQVHWNQSAGVELYNHLTDPEENQNLAYESAYHGVIEELSNQLHAGWRNSFTQASGTGTLVV